MDAVIASIYSRPWRPQDAGEILDMRRRLEESASPENLKRGPGGTMDAEFIVEMLQLKHGADRPDVRMPGTLDALAALGGSRIARGRRRRASSRQATASSAPSKPAFG